MASMRDVKQRIKSVKSTQQITKAMNLVSASKLQRAKTRLFTTLPYFNETKKIIASIVSKSSGISHKYLDARPVSNSLLVVINGDRGLCGGYNANIDKLAYEFCLRQDNPVSVVSIGSKAKDFFVRRKIKVAKSYTGISEAPEFSDAQGIGDYLLRAYENKEVDEVYLAYTEFKSTISHEPTMMRLLPVDTNQFLASETNSQQMDYEPNEETVLDYVIPKYINTVLFGALAQSAACEQGARMTAMDSATENAGEMIDDLTLLYNRARQGAITQEINEIVSGANALG